MNSSAYYAGTLRLLIHVHGLAEIHPERRPFGLGGELFPIHRRARPPRGIRPAEIRNVPLGGEPACAGGARLRQARADEARVRPGRRQAHGRFLRGRQETDVAGAVHLQRERKRQVLAGVDSAEARARGA